MADDSEKFVKTAWCYCTFFYVCLPTTPVIVDVKLDLFSGDQIKNLDHVNVCSSQHTWRKASTKNEFDVFRYVDGGVLSSCLRVNPALCLYIE